MKWGEGSKWGQGTKWGVGANPPTITVTSSTTAPLPAYTLTGTITSTTGVDFASYRLNGGPVTTLALVGGNFSEAVTLIPGRNLFVIMARGTNGLEATAVHAVAAPAAQAHLTSRNGLLSRIPEGGRSDA